MSASCADKEICTLNGTQMLRMPCVYAQLRTHTHTHTHTHTLYVHACVRLHIHTCTQSHTHTQTCRLISCSEVHLPTCVSCDLLPRHTILVVGTSMYQSLLYPTTSQSLSKYIVTNPWDIINALWLLCDVVRLSQIIGDTSIVYLEGPICSV